MTSSESDIHVADSPSASEAFAVPPPWWMLLATSLSSGRMRRLTAWTVVGLTGLVVNTVALWIMTEAVQVHYLVAAVAATQFSSTWNFALVDVYVYRGDKSSTWPRRLVGFLVAGNLALVVRIPLLALLVDVVGLNLLIANVLTLFGTFLGRFAFQEKLTLPKETV